MGDATRRVAITGASGYVGRRLVERLLLEEQVGSILAVDVRPPPQPLGAGVTFLHHDVSTPFNGLLSEQSIDSVVHLAYKMRPSHDRTAARRVNVGGTANLLRECTGVSRVVYLSSTSVYGAHPDNPPALTEDSPPRPVKGFQYSEDKLEAESLIQEYARSHRDVSATILRGCPVMGPNANNFVAEAFLKPFLVAVKGYDPPMQLLHEDDLTNVLARCVLGDAPGLYNIAGEGTILWSEMADLLGRRLVSLPAPLLYAATDAAWRLRLQSDSPASGLDLIRYAWVASTDRIRGELDLEFRYTSREAWEAFARQHNL